MINVFLAITILTTKSLAIIGVASIIGMVTIKN